jgi:hypothetical protein
MIFDARTAALSGTVAHERIYEKRLLIVGGILADGDFAKYYDIF